MSPEDVIATGRIRVVAIDASTIGRSALPGASSKTFAPATGCPRSSMTLPRMLLPPSAKHEQSSRPTTTTLLGRSAAINKEPFDELVTGFDRTGGTDMYLSGRDQKSREKLVRRCECDVRSVVGLGHLCERVIRACECGFSPREWRPTYRRPTHSLLRRSCSATRMAVYAPAPVSFARAAPVFALASAVYAPASAAFGLASVVFARAAAAVASANETDARANETVRIAEGPGRKCEYDRRECEYDRRKGVRPRSHRGTLHPHAGSSPTQTRMP